MDGNEKISVFKLLNEYKIGEQVWYVLIDADTLIITKKESCFPVWETKEWYSLIYNKDDKYETLDTVDVNMLMIQKQQVTISRNLWHYKRTCEYCGYVWGGLHCPHDGYQNPCPNCGKRPTVIKKDDVCDCEFDY